MFSCDYIAILGPTASGKTQLALSLAKIFPVEIISVDSVSVYKGLDIASAKPSFDERQAVKHHLIDEMTLSEIFTVADFVEKVKVLIREIRSRGAMPVLCGGTMMYMHAFCSDYDEIPKIDPEVEVEVRDILRSQGVAKLYSLLQKEDPLMANRLHENDQQRVSRALSVWRSTNRSLCDYWGRESGNSLKGMHFLLRVNDRQAHRSVIKLRTQKMIDEGLIDEVATLLKEYGNKCLVHPAMKSIGYKQAIMYLCETLTMGEVGEKIDIATSQLTKKQMTWLNRWEVMDYQKIDVYQHGKIINILPTLLDSLNK